jgi:hypothetical protein
MVEQMSLKVQNYTVTHLQAYSINKFSHLTALIFKFLYKSPFNSPDIYIFTKTS